MENAIPMTGEIGKRLRWLRTERGMSIAEVARKAELTESAVYRIESAARAKPQADTIAALARALGVSTDELLGMEPPPYAVGMGPVNDFVLVPLIGAESIGDTTFAEQDIEAMHLVPKALLPDGHEDACFLTEASGASMADVGITEGDQLLVCKGLPVTDGDIGVVKVDGEIVVKRVYRRNGRLQLVSDNSVYQPREVDESLLIGVVMWCRRMLKR